MADRPRATLDTTVLLGAVANPHGPNASVLARGLVGLYEMVLPQYVIAEAMRHLRRGFGKVPPLSDAQIDRLFARLFAHRWDPDQLWPGPPGTLDLAPVRHEPLGPWLVRQGYLRSPTRVTPTTRVGEVSPKDLPVLVVALQSDSTYLVTSNLADYPAACGIQILRPTAFLARVPGDAV